MEAPLRRPPVVPTPAPGMTARQPQDAVPLQAAAAQKPTTVTGREQCPRCASRDTKFCYYNNYNTAQPRHFCRACRRYWTLGGSLRNVPVGGSTRKRPRPPRPTRAVAVAATVVPSRGPFASPSPAAAPAAPAAVVVPSRGPFASSSHAAAPAPAAAVVPSRGPFTLPSPAAAPAPAPAPAQSGSLLSSLLLGSAPLLEGRLGFDLGLGQQAAGATGNMAQLAFGAGPLHLPATTVLHGARADRTWKAGGAFPPAAALWQELAGAPHLLP